MTKKEFFYFFKGFTKKELLNAYYNDYLNYCRLKKNIIKLKKLLKENK